MSQPAVAVESPLDAIGVRLLPFDAPEFQGALSPQRDKTFDYLLRYCAMLLNNTNKSIVAYSVQWICTDASGKISIPEDAWYDFSAFPSPSHLAAHRSKFVTPFGYDTFDAPPVFGKDPDNLPFFKKQKSVQIVLSAVLFDDGTAVGPDTWGWISRWSAYLTSEQQVYSAAAASSPATLRDLMTQYVHKASDLAKPIVGRHDAGDLDFGSFLVASTLSNAFDEQCTLQAGVTATALLLQLDSSEESRLRTMIQATVATKKYPQVKRQETP